MAVEDAVVAGYTACHAHHVRRVLSAPAYVITAHRARHGRFPPPPAIDRHARAAAVAALTR